MSENVCPHCGSGVDVWHGNGRRASCKDDDCGAEGPLVYGTKEEAIDAFCNPAYIAKEYEAKIAEMKETNDNLNERLFSLTEWSDD